MSKALFESKDKDKALDYLHKRKINKNSIEKFSIGWCPLSTRLDQKNEYLKYFIGRVIFPIKDEYGDIITFSGRYPHDDNSNFKWFHGDYSKSFYLYGLHESLDEIMKKDFVIVVEGQIDVIQCHQIGLTNTVGTMGTALTDEHLAKLNRFTENIVFMFDGDAPGRKISKKTHKKLITSDLYKKRRNL